MTSNFMVEKLRASGLSPSDVDATEITDFTGAACGFKLPYYTMTGALHPHMHRVRLERPAPNVGKYTQPSTQELVKAGHPPETATMPYLNPRILGGVTWQQVADTTTPKRLLIVEGEIKAACAGKLLLVAAIGIPGCWGGVRKDVAGVAHVHVDIKALLRRGDYVEVVLDGDILTNPDVNRAAGTLRRALQRLGVKVAFVILPEPIGVDDWLMKQPDASRIAAFAALPRVDGADFDECWVSVADFFGLAVSSKSGIALPTVSNLQILMERHERYQDRYYFDILRGNLYRNDPDGPKPIVDSFAFDEQVWLQRKFGMTVTKTTALDVLRWMSDQPRWRRNRVLDALDDWDKVPRLEEMFIKGWGADDNEYIRAIGKNWLVSALARANLPGCKVDTMLVLVGQQGIKKSMSLEAIASPELYVSTHSQVQDKDFRLLLHRGWLIDLAELSSMNHSDANHIKGIITDAVDKLRPPYGVHAVEMPRHSIMVGTTNEDKFLRDQTGNRRFWPVACGTIDIDWIRANRDQLLAEAQAAYRAGQSWWEMPEAATARVQEARMEVGPWDDVLRRILSESNTFRIVTVSNMSFRFITSMELMDALGIEVRYRKSHMFRDLAAAMRRVGGRKWEKWHCTQRITLSGGGSVEDVNGYRMPVDATHTATIIDFPPNAPTF
jgi:putative DNA primase/helicase